MDPDGAQAPELMEQLHALARRYLFRRGRGDSGEGPSLTREEARTLASAGSRTSWTMGELAAELVMAPGCLTGVVDRLVRKGLLERRRTERDRRVVELRLKPAGRALFREHRRRRLQMARAMLGALDAREQDQFLGLMRKIRERAAGPAAGRKGA